MAETEERSLDDFFAKRDKKKRREKGGRGAAVAAASSASSASSAPGGARPAEGGSGAAASTASSARAAVKEEDEWKEFEQKEEIDYSGLRVHSMQISEKEDDEGEKREEPGDNWEEAGGGVERASGPWNKTAPVQAPVAETIVTETPEPVQSSGVYRPPGARETRTRKAPQGPPEIYSDTQFPSLQSTAKHADSRKDKEMEKSFEVVRHKNRGRDEVSKNQALKLQLDNQYAVLGDQ
ncbi:protein CDV3 homolog isoform X1 [Terrapene carolina triunguis]|uniref:Protein CDV3 homolog n=1 Tax=Terrapene triunguis TaxID=2587831 RepID=A0A674K9D3_9SAUR|nr:protein CDV3 homolog isoform X1 [Terrapene carolina triunguis]